MQRELPARWKTYLLRDHTKIHSGGTPSTTEERYWSGDIPWITSADIVGINTIQPKRFITNEAINKSATHLVPKGNIILVSRVGLGKVAINQFDVCISQDSQSIIVDKDVFNVYYLANYLSVVAKKFVYQNQGTAIKGILKSDLELLEIPCPPIEEQNKIATILTSWDKAIEQLEQLVVLKSRFKKGLMQKLLIGELRFREFSRQKWVNRRMREIGKIISGGTPDTGNPTFWDGDINWCTPTDITALNGYKYLGATVRKISQAGYKNSSANQLPKNSVIVCTRATIGACVINTVPMTTNQGFKSIIPDGVDHEFLYYLLLHNKPLLERIACGSTFLEISKTDFEDIEFNMPISIEEQRKISSVLGSIDRQLDLLSRQMNDIKMQKQGLMQRLLTGKVRVRV